MFDDFGFGISEILDFCNPQSAIGNPKFPESAVQNSKKPTTRLVTLSGIRVLG
jgi:hypothetical protein